MKGDGLCCYLKVSGWGRGKDHVILYCTQVESVQLAIQLLHEGKYRDHTLHVERVSV